MEDFNRRQVEVLRNNRQAEIDLFREFCKNNSFVDEWDIGKSYQDYGERLRKFEEKSC